MPPHKCDLYVTFLLTSLLECDKLVTWRYKYITCAYDMKHVNMNNY